ncbi:MAG: DoxX family protein [Bacteroidetes bacterium]|nr:DoxX family protein [Bacteroidota bacterium]
MTLPKLTAGQAVSIVLSILLGAVFLFSGYTKLYPIEPFEYTFVDLGVAGWNTAPFVARLLIGLEFCCGALLIINFRLRRFTLPLVSGLLVAFCIYLTAVLISKGNSGNCGCFGEYLTMTPLEAIAKNIGLLLLCGLIYVMTAPMEVRYMKHLAAALCIVGLGLPFILNVVDLQSSKNLQPESVNYKVPLEILYETKNPRNTKPDIELRTGKHIIAYLSLTCPHCKIAAQKIHVLHKEDPSIPFYIVLNGKRELYEPYLKTYGLEDIPHELFFGPEEFMKMSGATFPQILWVNNSIVEKKGGYFQLNQKTIDDWLKE